VLVGLGGLLIASMATLSVVVARITLHTDDPGTTTRFTGGAEDVALIAGVFGFVIALGAGVVFGGAWQIRYGRPNRAVVAAAFVLTVLLLLLARSRRLIGF
jgi:hypothetical protein